MLSPIIVVALALFLQTTEAFQLRNKIAHPRGLYRNRSIKMFELEGDTAMYAGAVLATIIPSFFFVKFIGDQADSSRDKLSEKTKERFKKAMMEQPGANLSLPTSEEEALKKQIAKAYLQDKDVDVAVLEEKLRKRAQWRKEMIAQRTVASRNRSNQEDDEGW